MNLTPKLIFILLCIVLCIYLLNNSGTASGLMQALKSKLPNFTPLDTQLAATSTGVNGATNNTTTAPTYSTPNGTGLNYNLLLTKQMTSNEVKQLQTWLNIYLPSGTMKKLTIDGKFGNKTLAALQAFTGKSAITLNDALKAMQISNYVGTSNQPSTTTTPSYTDYLAQLFSFN